MQSPHRSQRLGSRAQIQVIGIAKDYRRVDLNKGTLLHGLDSALRTNGHKDRCRNLAVIGRDQTCTSLCVRISVLEPEERCCSHSTNIRRNELGGIRLSGRRSPQQTIKTLLHGHRTTQEDFVVLIPVVQRILSRHIGKVR